MATSEDGEKTTATGEQSKTSPQGPTDISEKDDAKISKKRRGSKTHGSSEKLLEKEGSTVSKKSEGRTSRSGSEKMEKQGSKASKKSGGRSSKKPSKEEPKAGTSGVSKKSSQPTKRPSKESGPSNADPSCTAPPAMANASAIDTLKNRIVCGGALLCISAIVIVLGFMAKRNMQQKATDNLPCISEECQEVAAMTESLLDPDVKPCEDFYRHVCGRWIKNSTHPSSFMIDAERNFSLARHQALMKNYGTGSYHELLNASSIFYRSCLAFLATNVNVKAATEELFRELNITVPEWLTQTDPNWFFAKVLHLSLVNRFHTLLSIGFLHSENDNLTFLIELSKPLHALTNPERYAALAAYLGEMLTTIGKEQASLPIIQEVLQLDKTRSNETIGLDEMRNVLEHTACPTFAGPLWTETLRRDVDINGSIFVMNYDAVCDDLEQVLVSTRTVARPLYLLLLLSADVLLYDFKLLADRAEHIVREVCYRATADTFGVLWLQLMSRFLNISESLEEAMDTNVGYAKAYMKKLVSTRTWMGAADKNATLAKIGKMRVARFYGGIMGQRDMDCFERGPVMPTGFVSNMVHIRAIHDVKNCIFLAPNSTEARIRLKLLDTTLAVEREALTVVLPHFFAVPPMFYRHVEDDKFINIAATGIQLARKMFSLIDRASSNLHISGFTVNGTSMTGGWSFGTLANFSAIQRCYEHVSRDFHERLTDAQFDEVFNFADGVRMGYAGKHEFARELVIKNEHRMRASDAMFFKRVCLPLCTHRDAPPNANTPSFAAAYASCLFAVASLPQFAEAFRCKSADDMSRINRCCVN